MPGTTFSQSGRMVPAPVVEDRARARAVEAGERPARAGALGPPSQYCSSAVPS